MPRERDVMVKTLPGMLRTVARTHAERPAIVSGAGAITYGELLQTVETLAVDLARRGLRPGGRVALLLENSPAFVIAYFAAAAAGAVIVPLNEQYQQTELLSFLDECGVSFLVASRDLKPLCDTTVALAREPCEVLWAEEWTTVAEAQAGAVREVPIDPDEPLMFQFSSGSTGRPKRIARTHANLIFELDALVRTLNLSRTDRFMGLAPFSHVNGLTRSMLASIRSGAALYPLPKYDRHATADLVERERITVFIAVPFIFSALAQTSFRRPPDFSSLRLCVSASAPMPRKLNLLFHEKFGMYVRQLYGSTETGTISVNLRPDIVSTLESVGTALDGVVVDVFGEDRRPLAAGEIGELAVSSPSAITRYAGTDPEHQAAFQDGFFFTGDLGRKDADGTIYLVGRKKFFINKGGFKIDPREVEEVLETHAFVEEVVVVGVPTPYGDERVKAVIVRKGPCTEAELVSHCRGKIADFKVPSVVEFRESLPKSPTGKIRRAMLI